MKQTHESMKKYLFLTALLPTLFMCRCGTTDRMITDKMWSRALGEEREVCIYLPEKFDPQQIYPVVYATDGQLLVSERYDLLLDRLIGDGTIPPVVVIGAYSNETILQNGMELRYYEYIADAGYETDDSADPEQDADPRIAGRFLRHREFFTGELRDSILSRYAIRPDPGKTLFYGCSNGGDYGMTRYMTDPEGLFTDYICLSPVGTEADGIAPAATDASLYVAYGDQEAAMPVLGDNLRALHQRLDAIGDDAVTVRVFEGGHNRGCWKKEFAAALATVLNR